MFRFEDLECIADFHAGYQPRILISKNDRTQISMTKYTRAENSLSLRICDSWILDMYRSKINRSGRRKNKVMRLVLPFVA